MIFTVQDTEGREQTFEGIAKVEMPTPFIGIAELADFNEIWALETTAAIEEVKRFYRTIHNLSVKIRLYRIGQFP